MELLLEVGCEEIPARFLPPALAELGRLLTEGLQRERLDGGAGFAVRTFGTPRRLGLHALGLPERQADLQEELLGPRVEAAFDEAGEPTKACLGFAKSRGLEVSELQRLPTAKGEVVGLRRTVAGQSTSEVLGSVVSAALAGLGFPKTMRWGEGEHTFVRPVHWLLALLDGRVLPITFGGIQAGGESRGHRFYQPEPFAPSAADAFVGELRARKVMADPAERRALIAERVRALAAEAGGSLVEDDGLLEEVTNLTEWPVPQLGRFDKAFLELPRCVLIAAMRNHQRYFSIERPDGSLLDAFVAVGNTPVSEPATVRHGNERVLTARLADARFFYRSDLRQPLPERVPRLQDMIFQADLGSYYEKSIRVANLSVALSHALGWGAWPSVKRVIEALSVRFEGLSDERERFSWQMARAALLSKTDLLTEMVGEFPELQGEMGGIYAGRAGEEPEVSQAIWQHYRPRGASDALPEGRGGAVLAIADRLDTLAGCFGVGLRPTGGADPYALRRATLGVIAVAIGRGLHFSLRQMLGLAVAGVHDKVEAALLRQAQERARKAAARKKAPAQVPAAVEPFAEGLIDDLLVFFQGRLRQRLAESHPADVVDAVLEAGMDDLAEAEARVRALTEFARQPAYQDLAVAFKRVVNILKGFECAELRPALFAHSEERELYEVATRITPGFDKLLDGANFGAALELLASELRGPVDRFFEKVLVNDPKDPERQANRKALLSTLALLFGRIADFSKLQTRES